MSAFSDRLHASRFGVIDTFRVMGLGAGIWSLADGHFYENDLLRALLDLATDDTPLPWTHLAQRMDESAWLRVLGRWSAIQQGHERQNLCEEIAFRTRAGATRYLSVWIQPLAGSADTLIFAQDISAMKAQVNAQTSDLVHDLRNHLAAIQSAAHLLTSAKATAACVTTAHEGLRRQIASMTTRLDSLIAAATADTSVVQLPPKSALFGKDDIPRNNSQIKRIVVADDNEDAALSLGMLLRMEGYSVEIAHDGLDAIRLAEQSAPDVMLLDLGMPGMDGYAVARAAVNASWSQGCRFIALSGRSLEEDYRRTQALGFTAHLSKPVDVDALLELLKR